MLTKFIPTKRCLVLEDSWKETTKEETESGNLGEAEAPLGSPESSS